MKNALQEETISEYNLKPSALINELLKFARDLAEDDEDDHNVVALVREAALSIEGPTP